MKPEEKIATAETERDEAIKAAEAALKEAEAAKAEAKQLAAEKAAALKEAEAAKAEAAALNEVVEPMAAELEKLKASPAASKVPNGTFKVAGKEYGFNYAAAILPSRGRITADDVLKSKDLQRQLVEMASGMVSPIKK